MEVRTAARVACSMMQHLSPMLTTASYGEQPDVLLRSVRTGIRIEVGDRNQTLPRSEEEV